MSHKDWIPHKILEFVELVKVWAAWLSDAGKQTAFGWDPALCAAVVATLNALLAAHDGYEADKTTEKKLTRDEARDAAMPRTCVKIKCHAFYFNCIRNKEIT